MKKYSLLVLSACLCGLLKAQSFDEKRTSVSNIEMTVTNISVIGNSLSGKFDLEGWGSCEYPVGSGVEHIFDGGLWVGGKIDGSLVAVTSGAVDAAAGYATGSEGFEFSAPVGGSLEERSSLFDSPFFHPSAVSHQDFRADFGDTSIFVPGTSIPIFNHVNPLGLGVHMETYNWNFSFANFFVILNYHITNVGTSTIEEPYIGFWADGVVRNVNITTPGGSAFFNKGGNGWMDTLFLGYEFDATGEPGFTDSYFALKYLGAEDMFGFHHTTLDTAFHTNFNTWQFRNSSDPLYFYPDDDGEKYGKMKDGLNYRSDFVSAIKPNIAAPNNRSNLISVGPFQTLAPGQSIDIAFAVVCARKKDDGNPNTADTDVQKENLAQNAFWAQTAYNGEDVNFNGILDAGEDRDLNGKITRYILPAPPNIPKVKYVLNDNSIDVYWSNNAESSVDPISKRQDFEGYRLYKTVVGFDVTDVQDVQKSLKLVGEWDKAGNAVFYDTGFEPVLLSTPVTFDGDTTRYRYKFTIANVLSGWQHAMALTAFDEGDAESNLESLESSQLASLKRLFPGKKANDNFANGDPFVYPNPYYAGASWEGASTFEEDRKMVFSNLPSHCMVRVYTVAGDMVDEFEHNQANYTGGDVRWFETYSDPTETQFSGGEHAWDLLSKDNQIIARGIYLFSVEDLDGGDIKQGKFVVIK
jgi:hypothetical protein